jgi:hypothetical protein
METAPHCELLGSAVLPAILAAMFGLTATADAAATVEDIGPDSATGLVEGVSMDGRTFLAIPEGPANPARQIWTSNGVVPISPPVKVTSSSDL